MGIRYTWQEPSPIRQIDIARNPSARLEATIYAPDNAGEKLSSLPEFLNKRGACCYLDEVNGQNVLRVTGVHKNATQLIELLKTEGFISGSASQSKIADLAPHLSPVQWVRHHSMNFAGTIGDLGHIATFNSGRIEKDPARMATGVLYFLSASQSALFGSGAGAIRFHEMMSDLRSYLEKEGVPITSHLTKTPEEKFRNRGTWDKVGHYIKTHPILFANSIGIAGNSFFWLSGWKEMRKTGMGVGRLVSGTANIIAAIMAIAIPEATKEEIEAANKKPKFWKTLFEGHVVEAFKVLPQRLYITMARMPLAWQGLVMLVDNGGVIFDAYQTKKKYAVWKHGGPKPLGLYDAAVSVFRGEKVHEPHELSHHDKIIGIDKKIHAIQHWDTEGLQHRTQMAGELNDLTTQLNAATERHVKARLNKDIRLKKQEIKTFDNAGHLFNADKPEEALRATETLADLAKEKKKLQRQLKAVELNPHGHRYAWGTAILYTLASSFNALGTKNRPKAYEAPAVYEELYAYSANMLLCLPEENRQRVIGKMAEYLAAKKDVHVKADDVAAGISNKLAVLQKSPWVTQQAPVATAETPTSAPTAQEKEAKPWLSKVTEQPAIAAAPFRA